MAEYIEREAAIKAVTENDCEGYATWAIKAVPAADVVPVRRGRWIRKVEIDGALKREYFVCSECGQTRMLNFHNYCPNCGALMKVNADVPTTD